MEKKPLDPSRKFARAQFNNIQSWDARHGQTYRSRIFKSFTEFNLFTQKKKQKWHRIKAAFTLEQATTAAARALS